MVVIVVPSIHQHICRFHYGVLYYSLSLSLSRLKKSLHNGRCSFCLLVLPTRILSLSTSSYTVRLPERRVLIFLFTHWSRTSTVLYFEARCVCSTMCSMCEVVCVIQQLHATFSKSRLVLYLLGCPFSKFVVKNEMWIVFQELNISSECTES